MIVASTDTYLQEDLVEPTGKAALFQLNSSPGNTRYIVYLLNSISNPRKTYVGYTVDLAKRIRQHNGEIVGGAKATRTARPWKIVGYLTGFPTNSVALQFEWRVHHRRRWGSGLEARIRVWSEVLNLEKWREHNLVMNWKIPYRLSSCPPNVIEVDVETEEMRLAEN